MNYLLCDCPEQEDKGLQKRGKMLASFVFARKDIVDHFREPDDFLKQAALLHSFLSFAIPSLIEAHFIVLFYGNSYLCVYAGARKVF